MLSTTRPPGTATVPVPVTSVHVVGVAVAFAVCHTRPLVPRCPRLTQSSLGLLGLTASPEIQLLPLSSVEE